MPPPRAVLQLPGWTAGACVLALWLIDGSAQRLAATLGGVVVTSAMQGGLGSPESSGFYEIAAIMVVAAVVSVVAVRLRQPLILAFIAVGFLVGPAVLGWVGQSDPVGLLSRIGVAMLLFVVGLKLDVHLVRHMGRAAVLLGAGQMVVTFGVGYGLVRVLGFAGMGAFYVALALTFSSTIIIVKLLSDKREIDELQGRLALGLLIMQDIVVILVMIALATVVEAGAPEELLWRVLAVVGRGLALLGGLALAMRYLLPRLLQRLARSHELMILFAISWAVSLAVIGGWLGLSEEVGAFLAGIALASTPYREVMGARLVGVRDFLLLFFFIDLGAAIDPGVLAGQIVPALVLSGFVLLAKPVVVALLAGALGYRRRESALTGILVGQISEFSLILAALGLALGQISQDVVGLVTLVGLITIGISTYAILYDVPIYDRVGRFIPAFERDMHGHAPRGEAPAPVHAAADVLLFGLGRYGQHVGQRLEAHGMRVLGVDVDPDAVRTWQHQGGRAIYGDAEDPEFVAHLPLASATWSVSTVPRRDVNLTLLHALRTHGFEGRVALRAHDAQAAQVLEEAGADCVLQPFMAAADRVVALMGLHEAPPEGGPVATDSSVEGQDAGRASRPARRFRGGSA